MFKTQKFAKLDKSSDAVDLFLGKFLHKNQNYINS